MVKRINKRTRTRTRRTQRNPKQVGGGVLTLGAALGITSLVAAAAAAAALNFRKHYNVNKGTEELQLNEVVNMFPLEQQESDPPTRPARPGPRPAPPPPHSTPAARTQWAPVEVLPSSSRGEDNEIDLNAIGVARRASALQQREDARVHALRYPGGRKRRKSKRKSKKKISKTKRRRR